MSAGELSESQVSTQRPRTQVRRLPERQVTNRAHMLAVLRAARLAHVAVVDAQGHPRVLPLAYGLDSDDSLILHGATSSQLFRAIVGGAPVCVTVTLLDGLVVANSSFNSSMNYRSVMIFGQGIEVPEHEREEVLARLSEHLFPGHNEQFRPLTTQELKATCVIRVPLTEMSMKSRDGGPDDAEDDNPSRWVGYVPVRMELSGPVPSEHVTAALPAHITQWQA